MKPDSNQIEFFKTIGGIFNSFAATNDISSPSHHTYIEEELNKLGLSEDVSIKVEAYIRDILFVGRNLKSTENDEHNNSQTNI